LEIGETLQQAAARECYEEALASVDVGSLLAVASIMYPGQAHIMFRARMLSPDFAAGTESLEVGLYAESDIPWADMAFASGEFTLRNFYADRAAGREGHHFAEFLA